MKKIIILSLAALFLAGCSEEKSQFEETVFEQMQQDKDLKDYNIDPETMAACVVDLTSDKMPGLFFWDPRRFGYYKGYSQLISVKKSKDPEQALEEVNEIFGTKKEAMRAVMNYSQSVMDCMTSLVSKAEMEQ